MLVGCQVLDLGRFFIDHLGRFFDRIYFQTMVGIDRLPLGLNAKYRLMVSAGWTLTLVLTAMAMCLVALIVWERGQDVIIIHSGPILGEGSVIRQATRQRWPSDLQIASDEAVLTVSEDQLVEMLANIEALTPAEEANLSQSERLNVALVYHYLGRVEEYQNWRERARQMDPNEHFFRDLPVTSN